MRKWSSLAAFLLALLCVPPALAAEDGESLVASVCRIIDSSALAQHLPVAFLTGLIWQESNFQPDAVSPAGARGIAQFMPGTAAERGLANPSDPEAAIPKAAELLANLKQRFGNLGLAAAAYNAGATRVANWLAGLGVLPPETRGYVMIVTRHPVEDWSGLGAAKLTDDAVFPDSSCVQHIAAMSREEPAVFANPVLWAPSKRLLERGSHVERIHQRVEHLLVFAASSEILHHVHFFATSMGRVCLRRLDLFSSCLYQQAAQKYSRRITPK